MDDGESVVEQNRKVAMNRYPGGRRQYNYPFFSNLLSSWLNLDSLSIWYMVDVAMIYRGVTSQENLHAECDQHHRRSKTLAESRCQMPCHVMRNR